MLQGQVVAYLGISRKALLQLVEAGRLSERRLPGCRPRYLVSEVKRLAEECTRRKHQRSPTSKRLETTATA
jgi:predicted site-specific integrase-resolvase